MNYCPVKGLVVILDGLGDQPSPLLDDLTPLEHATTPVLDQLARCNQSGLMDPLLPGLPVDTHTGTAILFGLPPGDAATLCRGPIEAAGIQLDMQYGDVLFRANLATVKKTDACYEIIDRRAGRIKKQVATLCEQLQDLKVHDSISASLFPATQHRCVLRLRGNQLSSQITDTDPGDRDQHNRILECHALDGLDSLAQTTATAVNNFTDMAYTILDNHEINRQRRDKDLPPANGVLARGVGEFQKVKNLLNYLAMDVAVVAAESTILGLGSLFSFDTLTDPGFTALADTDIEGKLHMAIQALDNHDLVYVHFKATDTTAHDRDPSAKSAFISRLDTALGNINVDNLVLGICADHSTDSGRGEHSGEPVPVLIHNPRGRSDQVTRFGETACSTGALGRITAQGFLVSVLDAMGRLSNYRPAEKDFFQLGH